MILIGDNNRQSISDTSNTCNVARQPGKKSRIICRYYRFIFKFTKWMILSVFSSGHEIETDTFDMLKSPHDFILNYTIGTELHHMHHKIIIHGSLVINNSISPIRFLSEEAQTSRNKDFKWYPELTPHKEIVMYQSKFRFIPFSSNFFRSSNYV